MIRKRWGDTFYMRATLFIVGFLMLLAVGIYASIRSWVTPPPYETKVVEVISNANAMCAGDVLNYRIDMRVDRAPVAITFADTWWNKDTDRTIVPARERSVANYPYPIKRTFETSVTVPVSLTPGNYWFLRSGQAESSATFMYSIPVTVVECK